MSQQMQSAHSVQEHKLIDLDQLLLGEEGAADVGDYIYRGAIKRDSYCVELLYVNKQGVIYRVCISTLVDVMRYIYFVEVGPNANYIEWLNILTFESYPLMNDMKLSYSRVVVPGTLSDVYMRQLRIRDSINGKSYTLFNTLAVTDYSSDPFSSAEDYCRAVIRLNQLSNPTPTIIAGDSTEELATLRKEIAELKLKLKAAHNTLVDLTQSLE